MFIFADSDGYDPYILNTDAIEYFIVSQHPLHKDSYTVNAGTVRDKTGVYSLGRYRTKGRAKFVFRQLQQAMWDGNNVFSMPTDDLFEDDL